MEIQEETRLNLKERLGLADNETKRVWQQVTGRFWERQKDEETKGTK